MEAKLIEVISKELSIDKDKINLDTRLYDDLGVDSIDLFNLIESIEKAFDVFIPEDIEVVTVGEILSTIEEIIAKAK